jgi:hypothetical protein
MYQASSNGINPSDDAKMADGTYSGSMTRDFPEGGIRVSDAERDRAIAELSEHFQAGRLTHDEFDDRSTRALQARTGDNLRALFTDLPLATSAGAPPAPAPVPGPGDDADPAETGEPPLPEHHHGQWPVGRIVIACVIASIVIGNVTGAITSGSQHVGSVGWVLPVVILLIVLRRMGRR